MNIEELLLHVSEKLGCRISLEPVSELFRSLDRLRIPCYMTLHNHAFCQHIKMHDGNHSCAENKHRSMQIAAHGRSFSGCCPYGIWELVQPVMLHGKLVAILYFGTCRDPSRHLCLSEYGPYSGPMPPLLTPQLKQDIRRQAALCAEFIRLELDIVVSSRVNAGKRHAPDYYCNLVYRTIVLHFKENLTLEDVAEQCNLNANYLSNFLKRHTGKTFRQLLTEQRLMEAAASLKYQREKSIAEVAQDCGFQDCNYFSQVFHKSFKVTPTRFKKLWHSAGSRGRRKGNAGKDMEKLSLFNKPEPQARPAPCQQERGDGVGESGLDTLR